MENILFKKRVRRKNKHWFSFLTMDSYYELETIPFKEKVYTFLYMLKKTGYTSIGETDWSLRMMNTDRQLWQKLESEFEEDFKEFAMQKQK